MSDKFIRNKLIYVIGMPESKTSVIPNELIDLFPIIMQNENTILLMIKDF